MSRSLRQSLLLRTVPATAVVLVLAVGILYALVVSSIHSQIDEDLVAKARLLASFVEQTPVGLEMDFEDLDMREFESEEGPGFLQLWAADGRVLYRSESLGGSDLTFVPTAPDEPVFGPMTLPHSLAGRAVTLSEVPRQEEDWGFDLGDLDADGDESANEAETALSAGEPAVITLVLARTTDKMDRLLARLRLLLILLLLAALLVISITITWAVSTGLRPAHRIANEIGALREQDLSDRIEEGAVPSEIRPVVVRLNDLLGRLDKAFGRERAFNADVAHELRTPLAGLQSILEVSLARPRSADEYRATLEDCLQVVGQMKHLVTNLLQLARIESGAIELDPQELSLDDIVRSTWDGLRERKEVQGLELRWNLAGDVTIVTDPSLLVAIIRNIFDNAISYVDEGGVINVTTTQAGGPPDAWVTLHVSNTGNTLTQDEAIELCDRFRRGDVSRTSAGGHYGLGLPLVLEMAAALGGEVQIQAEEGKQYEISIRLPRHWPR